MQRALDWAHEERGSLVLDNEVVIRQTIFLGNLHLINGGGKLSLVADEAYQSRADAGSSRNLSVCVMRSAPGNTVYAEPIETTYLVRIESGCRLDFVRSSSQAPSYPVRFTGLAEGSYINLNFMGSCLIDGDCNGPDWYFFNRCSIGGSYRLEFSADSQTGGFWFRDRDEHDSGPAYTSDFQFDNPSFVKVGGRDECVAIFTSQSFPGRLKARGSLNVDQSSGIGFSIFNSANSSPAEFDVALDAVTVRSNVRDGQAVIKIMDGHARIAALDATVTGLDGDVKQSAVLRCGTDAGGPLPIINQARLASAGGGPKGFQGVKAVLGDCALGSVTLAALPPLS